MLSRCAVGLPGIGLFDGERGAEVPPGQGAAAAVHDHHLAGQAGAQVGMAFGNRSCPVAQDVPLVLLGSVLLGFV